MKTFQELNIGDSVFYLDESDDQMDEVVVTGDYTDSSNTIEVAYCDGEKVELFVDGDESETYYDNYRWFADKEAMFDYLQSQIDRYTYLMKALALH